MKGLDLAQDFFESYGRPMLESDFSELLPYLAAGLFGMGSECFGFDDEVSRDHDFEPAFCLFLPGEDVVDRRKEFLLERAYAKLPRVFCGFRREAVLPVGGARHGILRTADFFRKTAGSEDGNLSAIQWLTVPEQSLAEATNGAVFYDGYGEVSRIRQNLAYFPRDIRLKRLAGNLLLMGQAGQYNYSRCLLHGELEAAQLAVFEFVKHTLSVAFLLNCVYQPYYKWSFRALRRLPILSELADALGALMTGGNVRTGAEEKRQTIEQICSIVCRVLMIQELSFLSGNDLERHAYAVNDLIQDSELRNMHILAAL
ncbi:MAG: DUF4037 domain-containing protein [Oscillospiraceae bacterium]|nr:DUF4037 domain-containing protein [Oscillospiraceae bacterium]